MSLFNRLMGSVSLLPLYAADGAGGGAGGDPPRKPVVPDSGTGDDTDNGDDADNGGQSGDDAGDDQGVDGGESDDGDDAQGDPPAAAAPLKPVRDWRDRELNRKHAQIQEQKRRADELARENQEYKAMLERVQRGEAVDDDSSTATRPAAPHTPEDVRAAAAQMVAEENFKRDTSAANAKGREEYGEEWDGAVDNLTKLGGFDIETMTGILATDNPAKVLYELGSNPDNYHRIMELPGARRQNELVKLAMTPPKKRKQISSAPAPVDPIRGRTVANSDALSDDLTDEEWYARRARQRARRQKERGAA